MSQMLIGKKIGTTRLYDESGIATQVTIIQAGPCPVTQIKTEETDGYNAVQIGFGLVKKIRQKKATVGHAKKSGADVNAFYRELRLEAPGEITLGELLSVSVFEDISYVDVTGTSKGKGFAGGMKRHGFKGLEASHGVERKHRCIGSISGSGGSTGTSRGVRKGKRMAGHMGDIRKTSKNHKVVSIDVENNLILVKGSIAGANNGIVTVRTAKTKK